MMHVAGRGDPYSGEGGVVQGSLQAFTASQTALQEFEHKPELDDVYVMEPEVYEDLEHGSTGLNIVLFEPEGILPRCSSMEFFMFYILSIVTAASRSGGIGRQAHRNLWQISLPLISQQIFAHIDYSRISITLSFCEILSASGSPV
jgi:hypothetical protein